MARIKDVAQEANVSIATVSRVINNIPLVNEDTRQRVLAAIRKTGYRPNAVARSLKLQRSNIIGVIVSDISRPVMAGAIEGIQEELSRNGYSALISYTKGSKNSEAEALESFFLRQCDGIILIGTNVSSESVGMIKNENTPFVSCLVVSEDEDVASVGFDEYTASVMVIDHLYNLGHRRIGAFIGNELYTALQPRIRGFLDAMKKYDLTLSEDWIIRGPMTFEGGYESACQLASLPEEKLPTAIYCFNDDIAIGAIKGLYSTSRIVVPDDISIISYNGTPYAQWSITSLTSLKVDSYEAGRKSAEAICGMIKTGEITNTKIYIPVSISEGESVKDINE